MAFVLLYCKVVPVVRQPTFGRKGKDRKYIIASLAENNLKFMDSQRRRERSVPHMTVDKGFKMLKWQALVALVASFSGLFISLGLGMPDSAFGVLLTLAFLIGIQSFILTRSDWFCTRVKDIFMDSSLPSNPYHDQFDSVSEFRSHTKR